VEEHKQPLRKVEMVTFQVLIVLHQQAAEAEDKEMVLEALEEVAVQVAAVAFKMVMWLLLLQAVQELQVKVMVVVLVGEELLQVQSL
jgi:hypothetical protein